MIQNHSIPCMPLLDARASSEDPENETLEEQHTGDCVWEVESRRAFWITEKSLAGRWMPYRPLYPILIISALSRGHREVCPLVSLVLARAGQPQTQVIVTTPECRGIISLRRVCKQQAKCSSVY